MQQALNKRNLILGVLLLSLAACQAWVTYKVFTSRFPGGNDFAARWFNGCALIWEGKNPYSDEVTLQTQIHMYGRPALPGEDLAAFSYPLYTLFFFWPLCYFRPYTLVQAIWMTLMLYGVIAATLATIRLNRLELTGWKMAAVLLWVVVCYPQARAILLGQFVIVAFLAIVLALLALDRGQDLWAGVALAVATVKPQVVFLLVIWLLWWSAWNRRWRLWMGFSAALALLVGAGLVLVPGWIPDFARHIFNYANVTVSPYYSLTWIITRHFLGLGVGVEMFASACIAVYLLAVWWRYRRATGQARLWVSGVTLNLTFFLAVQIATTGYILLLVPLFQLFQLLRGTGSRLATASILVGAGLLLVGQWAIFFASIEGNFETAPSYLLLPISLVLAQVIVRVPLTREAHA